MKMRNLALASTEIRWSTKINSPFSSQGDAFDNAYIQRTWHPLASIWDADIYGPEGAS